MVVWLMLKSFSSALSRWVWAKAVTRKLKEYIKEHNESNIRFQKRIHLPSGKSPRQYLESCAQYGGTNEMIEVPADVIEALVEEHVPANWSHVVEEAEETLANELYEKLGFPVITGLNAWDIWGSMIDLLETA